MFVKNCVYLIVEFWTVLIPFPGPALLMNAGFSKTKTECCRRSVRPVGFRYGWHHRRVVTWYRLSRLDNRDNEWREPNEVRRSRKCEPSRSALRLFPSVVFEMAAEDTFDQVNVRAQRLFVFKPLRFVDRHLTSPRRSHPTFEFNVYKFCVKPKGSAFVRFILFFFLNTRDTRYVLL